MKGLARRSCRLITAVCSSLTTGFCFFNIHSFCFLPSHLTLFLLSSLTLYVLHSPPGSASSVFTLLLSTFSSHSLSSLLSTAVCSSLYIKDTFRFFNIPFFCFQPSPFTLFHLLFLPLCVPLKLNSSFICPSA